MDVEDGSDDETKVTDFVASRNAAVFCIDSSERMLEIDDDSGKCPLQICLESVKRRMLNNIFTSDKEFIGIVLMGAVSKAGSSNNANNVTSNNCSIFFELSRFGSEICSTLANLAKKTGEQFKKDFCEEYDVQQSNSLSDSLWTCSSMMSMSNTKFGVKEVFIMTNSSMENMDQNVRRQTLKRVEALSQVGICLRLLYLGANFDLQPFYKDLLLNAHPDSSVQGNEHWAASDLVADPHVVLTRGCNNRQSGRLDFSITPKTKITVKAYSLFRRIDHISMRQDVKLHKETNEQLSVASTRYDTTSGELVHPDSVVFGIKVAEGASYFKKEERGSMKELYPIGIALLGFKPISEVFWGDHIKSGILIIPDEEERSGSASLFYGLLQVCVEKNLSPLVRICMRKGSGARLAHLLPQLENSSVGPFAAVNCFYLIYLPFSGECRESEVAVHPIDVDLNPMQNMAKTIIQKTTFKYHPSMFPNPKMRMHFNAIEALALDYDDSETVIDALQPDEEGIDSRIGEVADQFMKMSEKVASLILGVDDNEQME
ncbi:X-ray repair cross-complementing protein 6-like isoform X2 [Neocloeon triangulifer]|nr:X-ray repair cross-complementing protein 6-like isoform X2 [Neocloeon triangulifer]XP_059490680.1 X-ray repair cross-complementing protein 6-like isoform X2 [Neocloeon triangulifer]